jgi:hypothetical protein
LRNLLSSWLDEAAVTFLELTLEELDLELQFANALDVLYPGRETGCRCGTANSKWPLFDQPIEHLCRRVAWPNPLSAGLNVGAAAWSG